MDHLMENESLCMRRWIARELLANMNHISLKENTRDVRVWPTTTQTFSVSNFVLQFTPAYGECEGLGSPAVEESQ